MKIFYYSSCYINYSNPIYLILIHIIKIFFDPCKNIFDYAKILSGRLYYSNKTSQLGITDWLVRENITNVIISIEKWP